MTVADGLGLAGILFLTVVALVLLFGIAALSSLKDFEATNPSLKVYANGLALPWRSAKAAKRHEENVLRFDEIEELQVLRGKRRLTLLIVRRTQKRLAKFLIDSRWIPNVDELVQAIQGKVRVRFR